jgi:hypothetical protein
MLLTFQAIRLLNEHSPRRRVIQSIYWNVMPIVRCFNDDRIRIGHVRSGRHNDAEGHNEWMRV